MADLPKVFISYAREDQPHAVRLSKDLEALGVQPWLDVTHMIPGGDWRMQIEDALDSCDYVVLLLSQNSIEKTGYVQAEKRYILDRLNNMPPDAIFLIPVRLEECNPRHRQITRLHRVDLFPSWDEGFRKLARAFKFNDKEIEKSQATRRTITSEPEVLSTKDYFDRVLPIMLRYIGEKAIALNKKIRFILSDQLGESWTINLMPPIATVVAKDKSDVDLMIILTSECMQSMISGDFDAKKALTNGNIDLFGDVDLLKTVGRLFSSV